MPKCPCILPAASFLSPGGRYPSVPKWLKSSRAVMSSPAIFNLVENFPPEGDPNDSSSTFTVMVGAVVANSRPARKDNCCASYTSNPTSKPWMEAPIFKVS